MSRTALYNPPAFRLEDEVRLGRLIDTLVFGTLVTNGDHGPRASHLPFLLERSVQGPGTLRAHLARVNEHWRELDGQRALVIFQGPQHYVTPSWYASKRVTGRVVPTWNYVTVHVRGRVSVYRDVSRLKGLVTALTDRMERSRAEPWGVDDAPADFVERMLGQIVGVDLAIEAMEGKLKLGQNRPAGDRESLAAGIGREQPELWDSLSGLAGLSGVPAADDET